MEERMSWSEAIGVAIGNLTGVNSESSSMLLIRALFILIFAAGTGLVGYNFLDMQEILQEKDYPPAPRSSAIDADKKRLKDMVDQVQNVTSIRKHSQFLARDVEAMQRYIFGPPPTVEPPITSPDIIIGLPVEVVIEMPPEIVVRAIMVIGKQRVAVMDIAGVGSGIIVKPGDTFMQRKGRIVRISSDKVVVRWGNRSWDIAPGL